MPAARDDTGAPAPRLKRETFRTSRLLEFCSQKELIAQTGHSPADWPLVIEKELVDNALDACEEAGIAPDIVIEVSTSTGEICVSDNGPGLPRKTVDSILDYSIRASSREAYCSPTRGAQGNATKTLIAMPFALDGKLGRVRIDAAGVSHRIAFSVDHLRQEPAITHEIVRMPAARRSTAFTVFWPDSASSILASAKSRFVQIAADYAWLNPHARITLAWDNDVRVAEPTDPSWRKWRPSLATSSFWYDQARFERYIAAHVAHDRDTGRKPERTVREFVGELDGFRRSAAQKRVLDETSMHRMPLSSLFGPAGEPHRDQIAGLLHACKKHSRPVKPHLLGLIGKEHLLSHFEDAGVHKETFKYKRVVGETHGLPWVVETAFGYCPEKKERRIIAGVNFSVSVGNPFRSFHGYGGEGLEAHLNQLRAAANEPVVVVVHYTCPRVDFTDRGKTAIALPE
jgi:DNA topoisomerase VI subunit B